MLADNEFQILQEEIEEFPVYMIILIGRWSSKWSSNAFLLYIHKQVQEFSRNISTNMMQNESFFTIPSIQIED
jgi:hypothetical protein